MHLHDSVKRDSLHTALKNIVVAKADALAKIFNDNVGGGTLFSNNSAAKRLNLSTPSDAENELIKVRLVPRTLCSPGWTTADLYHILAEATFVRGLSQKFGND